MRLDVAQMRAPRSGRLIDEFDRFAGQPRGFAILFADVGRLIRMPHHPTGCFVAGFINAGIGEIGPRVFARIALRLQIGIIGRALLVIKPIRPLAP